MRGGAYIPSHNPVDIEMRTHPVSSFTLRANVDCFPYPVAVGACAQWAYSMFAGLSDFVSSILRLVLTDIHS